MLPGQHVAKHEKVRKRENEPVEDGVPNPMGKD